MNDDLKNYQEHLKTNKFTSKELWVMKYAVMSNLHPETEKPVFSLCRWSAYAPMNIPIIVLLAILPPTTMNQVIGQSLNQSLNFGVNVTNASATNTMDLKETGSKALFFHFLSTFSTFFFGKSKKK